MHDLAMVWVGRSLERVGYAVAHTLEWILERRRLDFSLRCIGEPRASVLESTAALRVRLHVAVAGVYTCTDCKRPVGGAGFVPCPTCAPLVS